MDYKDVLNELYSLDTAKIRLGLENIKRLLKELGNPEKKLKCIHVAGTNGKGSVCSVISAILQNAGYRVGMYTSPHLKKFNERIRVNNKLISDKEIVGYYLRIKKKNVKCSFFELTTAMAFLYFYEKKVDFVVLEVGLGGRLDATNVVRPLASVITNIGYEHTNILGKTIKKIAYEKSGIIKNKVPVVTGADGTALKTIKSISNNKNSILFPISEENIKKYTIKIKNKEIYPTWHFDFNGYKDLVLKNLKGKFQAINAAIAIKTIEIIKKYYNIKINKTNIKNGLKNAYWPRRFEFVEDNVLVDCAHNPSGFKILINELKYLKYRKLILVAGFSEDKNIKKISEIIGNKADIVILTKSTSERSADPEKMIKFFQNPKIIKMPKKALSYARSIAGKKDLVLVTGSIYLVGDLI